MFAPRTSKPGAGRADRAVAVASDHAAEHAARRVAWRALPDMADQAAAMLPEAPAGTALASLSASAATPLDASLRAYFGARFGADLSAVRVHRDAIAAQAADALDARAFTSGNRIAFAAGAYAPGTPDGKALLAHELAHVAQRNPPGVVMRQPKPVAKANRYWDAQKIKDRVRALDTSSNKELHSLVKGADLYGNDTVAFTSRPKSGTAIDWHIVVKFDKTLDPQGVTRGKTDETVVSAASGKTPEVRRIDILLNPDSVPTAEEVTLYKPLEEKERRHRMVAVTLLHELMHARLGIGAVADASGKVPASATLDAYNADIAAATGAATQERTAAMGQIAALVRLGDSTLAKEAAASGESYTTPGVIDTPAKITTFAAATIQHMVEERFAKLRSSKAEGLKAVTNATVADAYGDQVDRTIRSFFPQPNTLGGNTLFTQQIGTLKTLFEKLFAAIDTAVSAPPAPQAQPPAKDGGAP